MPSPREVALRIARDGVRALRHADKIPFNSAMLVVPPR